MKLLSVRNNPFQELKVMIDDEDFDLVSKYSWTIKYTNNKPYVHGYLLGHSNGKTKRHYLHRLIMNADKTQIIDHIDDQKSNLRFCTLKQNAHNKKKGVNNTSGYKGVFKSKYGYKAYLRQKYLGESKHPYVAALLYDVEAKKQFGEFARCNILQDGAFCNE